MNKEQENNQQSWVNADWDIWAAEVQRGQWDLFYGEGNWRLIWQLPNKEVLGFDQLFEVYVGSYVKFFEENPVDALFLTNHFSYVYSHDSVSKVDAFDPHASYDRRGKADQFHHVAINLALVNVLGLEFKGPEPIGGNDARFWSPNQIPPHSELFPTHPLYPTLNDLYKHARKLQIKK